MDRFDCPGYPLKSPAACPHNGWDLPWFHLTMLKAPGDDKRRPWCQGCADAIKRAEIRAWFNEQNKEDK